MAEVVRIEVENGMANIYTPYNPEFVKKIKQVGGAKWNAEKKCWRVPEAAIDAAREIMVSVYGYSDIAENETVTVKVTFTENLAEWCGDVTLYGKVLAHARGRDTGARVGDDVSFIQGEGATSGGSAKNWSSVVKAGSVAILHNVNKRIYEQTELPEGVQAELLEDKPNRAALMAEKERLLKRIEEIDKLLQV